MKMKRQITLLVAMAVLLLLPSRTFGGIIVAWGNYNYFGQLDVPDGNDFVAIAAGQSHGLAIRSDGTLVAWGNNDWGLANVPDGNDFVAVATGGTHGLALRSNGKIEAWGGEGNNHGQCDVPDGNYIAIGAGHMHSLAIRTDGSIAHWGYHTDRPYNTPPSGNDFIMVTGGKYQSLALKPNGSIAAWPCDANGMCNVPDGNYIDIASSWLVNFALKEDGTIVAWGVCEAEKCNVPDSNGFKDIGPGVAIDANGALAAWFDCLMESPPIPPDPNDPNSTGTPGESIIPDGNGFVAIDAGGCFGIALTSSETHTLTVAVEPNFVDCVVPAVGEYEYYRGEWVRIDAPRCPNCPDVYKFDHWEGDVDDPNAQSAFLTMDRDRTITAVYVPDERVCGDECHPILQGDINEDCYINFEDFAIYAAMWLSCTHPDCD